MTNALPLRLGRNGQQVHGQRPRRLILRQGGHSEDLAFGTFGDLHLALCQTFGHPVIGAGPVAADPLHVVEKGRCHHGFDRRAFVASPRPQDHPGTRSMGFARIRDCASSSEKWQAALCPSATCRKTGASTRQRSRAMGQRV